MIDYQLAINHDSTYLEPPWSIRRKMIDFVQDQRSYFQDKNLKYMTVVDLNERKTRLQAKEDGKVLIPCDKKFPTIVH